jgi:hypothetical protein
LGSKLIQSLGRRNVDTTAPWTVPFARDHNFVGREDIIEKVLNAMTTPDSHRRMALTGFGGMGYAFVLNCFRKNSVEASILGKPVSPMNSLSG